MADLGRRLVVRDSDLTKRNGCRRAAMVTKGKGERREMENGEGCSGAEGKTENGVLRVEERVRARLTLVRVRRKTGEGDCGWP